MPKRDLGYQDSPFAVEIYDHMSHVKAMTDVPFWLKYARASGGPVLELGCGTGRVTIPIAREGIEITGLDVSSLMLDRARTKLAAEPEEVRRRVSLVEASMHDFALGREFALIFSAFRSFQAMKTVKDQLSCLRCVRSHLKKGGRLILDVFNPHMPYLVDESRKEEFDEEQIEMPDGRTVTARYRNPAIDPDTQTRDCEMIYYIPQPDGSKQRVVWEFQLHYFFRFELEHLLVRAGFEIEDVFSDFDESPFGTKSPGEILMVARKV